MNDLEQSYFLIADLLLYLSFFFNISAMDITAIALQSGSNGNCIYIEADGVKLLFDAGINGKQAEVRLAAHGRDIREIDAVIISHDHGDHVRHAGVYQRKYGLPLYVTEKTCETAVKRHPLGKLNDVHFFRSDGSLQFGGVSVEALSTPHDTADGAVFVVSSNSKRLGIMTDLGHVFDGLPEVIGSLDAVFLESNYDPTMLESGPYPSFLKKRIRGLEGHLSNREAAELLEAASGGRMKWACLSHLSEQNNSPSLALRTHRTILRKDITLHVASRYSSSPLLCI
ncbi:MAG: MBL fold metallo-hydrolase [Nitrospiraceae bacterium]|nr:MAG: MBL fold metallo-hydrolase [Nitrospiraceae bacterium]